MQRVVDISTNGRHLSVSRGHMLVSEHGKEVGRIPLDDISTVLIHAHGITYSNGLICALSERNVLLVISNTNQMPVAVLTPLFGHHLQTQRMVAQAGVSLPVKKRMWQKVVSTKIRMQAATLSAFGISSSGFLLLERKIRSGDPENVEAQAARRYWPLLFGDTFRRDRRSEGINALLNFGYAILRASCARSIVGVGLNPSLGIHHHSQSNPLCLADDLIEPFRPIVDATVKNLVDDGILDVSPDAKARLARILCVDMQTSSGNSPLHLCVHRLAQSVVESFVSKKLSLEMPSTPTSIWLKTAGRAS